jgi:CheY-like chemotaxis protein
VTDRARVSVVLVEDDAAMARLLRHVLEEEGYRNVRHAWTGDEALAGAADAEIVVLDQQLPDMRGLDLLPRLRDRPHPPSVIMVTAHGSEFLAATALRQGAEDYLTKDHTLPELLPRVLERVRRTRALQDALTTAEEELVRTERLTAIGEMAVTLHHELNNPLMAALAEVELALGDGSLPAEHREGLDTAREALLRIRDILLRTRDLKRAETMVYRGGVRMIDLSAQASDARTYRGRAVLYAPDQRMTRILTLLLRNAGFQVERSPSAEDARSAAEMVGVALVVVAGGGDPDAPAATFPSTDDRAYTLVFLGAPEEPGAVTVEADLVLPLPFDPATVVEEIVEAMKRRERASKGE